MTVCQQDFSGRLRGPALPREATMGAGEAVDFVRAYKSDVVLIAGRVFGEHRWLLCIYGCHLALGVTLSAIGILPITVSPLWDAHFALRYLMITGGGLVAIILVELVRGTSADLIRRRYLAPERVVGAGLVSLIVAQESLLHAAWKRTIGRVNPFRWDEALANIDEWMHAGTAPWEILRPLIGETRIVGALDTAYWLWFPIMLAMGAVLAWLPDRALRMRAYVAWGLVWLVLGTLCAQVFASAGPVFYSHVVETGDPGRYTPLLAQLQDIDQRVALTVLDWHELLWANFTRKDDVAWLAISAMPSMHVAMPVLFSLILRRLSLIAGATMAAFAVITFCASVYLGWHYAADGYVAVVGVWCCWWFAGVVVRRDRFTRLSGRGLGREAYRA